jgi:hypothetical protein
VRIVQNARHGLYGRNTEFFYVKGDGTYCNHSDFKWLKLLHRIILVRKLSLCLNILTSETVTEGYVAASIFVTCFHVHSLHLQIPESHGNVELLQCICICVYICIYMYMYVYICICMYCLNYVR